jgi:tripeptide aminopeptidase
VSVSARGGPPDELERRRLNDSFAELCRIESPSGSERACAEWITKELRSLGIEVEEDDAGAAVGSDCGNLLARIPGGTGAPSAPGRAGGARPREEGFCENANDGILGADNKAAVAVLLALARRVRREELEGSPPPVDIELLFTVGEERSLAGVRAFEVSRLRSRFGYVFDHSSPVGEVILSSPTHHRLQATFRGLAAHSGVRPEEGRSAILAAARAVADMRLGRLDAHTTANVGTIAGGSAINVVPERCTILAEVRSGREERAEEILAEMLDCVHEAANLPECECDVDVTVERTFTGYRTSPSTPAVRAAESALRSCGYEPVRVASGGASDANALIAAGFPTVNLANGTERNHEPGERVSVAALEAMFEVALALLATAADVLSREAVV